MFKDQVKVDHEIDIDAYVKACKQDYLSKSNLIDEVRPVRQKKFYIETYGCQMNESDTEIVNSILTNAGYEATKHFKDANIVLLNTCAIRENAESKIWNRLTELRAIKNKTKKSADKLIVAVLGCMAERLKDSLVEKNKAVDIIVGPDSYRDLPRLIDAIQVIINIYVFINYEFSLMVQAME